MTNPYRATCPDCDTLRKENVSLKTSAKKRRWVDVFGSAWRVVVIAHVLFFGILISGYVRGYAARPEPPEACHETAEIITVNGSTRVCNIGGTMTTEVLPKQDGNQQVLVRCRCAQEHDGGAK